MMITDAFRVWTGPPITRKLSYSEINGGPVPKRRLLKRHWPSILGSDRKNFPPGHGLCREHNSSLPSIAGSRPSNRVDNTGHSASRSFQQTEQPSHRSTAQKALVTQRGRHGQRRDSGLSACRTGWQLSCAHGL